MDNFGELRYTHGYKCHVLQDKSAGAHLGFSEGRGPKSRKQANQYKTKKKQI